MNRGPTRGIKRYGQKRGGIDAGKRRCFMWGTQSHKVKLGQAGSKPGVRRDGGPEQALSASIVRGGNTELSTQGRTDGVSFKGTGVNGPQGSNRPARGNNENGEHSK